MGLSRCSGILSQHSKVSSERLTKGASSLTTLAVRWLLTCTLKEPPLPLSWVSALASPLPTPAPTLSTLERQTVTLGRSEERRAVLSSSTCCSVFNDRGLITRLEARCSTTMELEVSLWRRRKVARKPPARSPNQGE